MSSRFFALLSRMKYINRWGLMRSTTVENVAEHSLIVCWVAHALATIENKYYGGTFDACRVGMVAAYHETGEVITGDLPTPIKYFSPEMKAAYKKVEKQAERRILSTLPSDLESEFQPLVQPDGEEKKLVKYADKLTAYIKCLEECKANNSEFTRARDSIAAELRSFDSPSVNYFIEHFLPAFELTLDELGD